MSKVKILILAGLLLLAPPVSGGPSDVYFSLRKSMVDDQIKSRGIQDPRVIGAMMKVQRHLFMDPSTRNHAYVDSPYPIGHGQTISQPYIVALMTELLQVQKNHSVLEIGTGSGYQAALLGELAHEVFTIEIVKELGHMATKTLKNLGYANIQVKIGDGYEGWPEKGPFDRIMVTAAPPHVPPPLIEQLAPGGRMVIPVGDAQQVQELLLLEKQSDGKIIKNPIIPVRFVPFTRQP